MSMTARRLAAQRRTIQRTPSTKSAAAPPAMANTQPARAPKRTCARASPPDQEGQAHRSSQEGRHARGRHQDGQDPGPFERTGGASLDQLRKATGWQAHSVRGFLSGTLKKKMGLRVASSKVKDGQRTYRIVSK